VSGQGSAAEAPVWVLGSLNLDLFRWDDGRSEVLLGGMALNAWRMLADLGRAARLVAAVGADPDGRDLLSRMRQNGIAAEHVHRVAGSPTGRAVYGVDAAGATLLDLRLHGGLGAERLRPIREGGGPVLIMGASLPDVAAVATARPLLWNPGQGILEQGQEAVPWPTADVLFVNRREQRTYLDRGGPRCPLTLVTHHGEGAALLVAGEEVAYHRPEGRHDGLDVGAGDAFAAAFTHAHLLGLSPAECLAFAGERTARFLRQRVPR
jgi:ribokinase